KSGRYQHQELDQGLREASEGRQGRSEDAKVQEARPAEGSRQEDADDQGQGQGRRRRGHRQADLPGQGRRRQGGEEQNPYRLKVINLAGGLSLPPKASPKGWV